jgi:Tfp pilus assembly protein PilX
VSDTLKKLPEKQRGSRRKQRSAERGVALVIAIFTLMLISVVATALILMAGTASAIKANYKSSMQAFYDAKAGLEEGRSRLWTGNANPLNTCVFPGAGSPMPTNRVCYIVNPDPTTGETVNPTDLSPTNIYADTEYRQEFGVDVTAANVQPFVNSTSRISSPNIAGPLYKWVRITPVTQQSSGTGSQTTALFYDGIRPIREMEAPPAPRKSSRSPRSR